MSVKEVVDATRGRLLSGPHDMTFLRLFTDSREVKAGGLFVALRGEQLTRLLISHYCPDL